MQCGMPHGRSILLVSLPSSMDYVLVLYAAPVSVHTVAPYNAGPQQATPAALAPTCRRQTALVPGGTPRSPPSGRDQGVRPAPLLPGRRHSAGHENPLLGWGTVGSDH